jgi:hypothetical protein
MTTPTMTPFQNEMWRLLSDAEMQAAEAAQLTGADALELFADAANHIYAVERCLRGAFGDTITDADEATVTDWLTSTRMTVLHFLADLA